MFLKTMLYDLVRTDKDYLALYKVAKFKKIGKEFGDGTSIGMIFEKICALKGQERIGLKILEIFRIVFIIK